jgi:hypothetical protein
MRELTPESAVFLDRIIEVTDRLPAKTGFPTTRKLRPHKTETFGIVTRAELSGTKIVLALDLGPTATTRPGN